MVIFDLDDTLIETSKCITPHYLRQAFLAMQRIGSTLGRVIEEKSFFQLLSINTTAISSRQAIKEFCRSFPEKNLFYKAGLAVFSQEIPETLTLESVPDAKELLNFLIKHHTLALVTSGDVSLQLQKLEKAGIQPEQFSKLIVSKGPSKKLDYKEIIEKEKISIEKVIVCGDRVPLDLSPAKELGIRTVHFRNGRGKIHSKPESDVDFTIDTLKELYEVLT